MTDTSPSQAIEREIQSALIEHQTAETAARFLLRKYEILDLPIQEFETLGAFFINAGFPELLCTLSLIKLEIKAVISWPHFLQALSLACSSIPLSVKKAFVHGAKKQKCEQQLARCHVLDKDLAVVLQMRLERRAAQQEHYKNLKKDLLGQLEMFRIQELDQEEERIVQHLINLFPQDDEILGINRKLFERRAVHLLENKLHDQHREIDPQFEVGLPEYERLQLDVIVESMRIAWQEAKNSTVLGQDFAIALIMWEYPEAALEFLRSKQEKILWTRLEALFLSRQYINLLTELDTCPMAKSSDPDCSFALSYLRALALWGLGQKFPALEIIENIVAHRPNYRSALTLLRIWKGGAA